ncbi:MAG: hypothetical protein RLZZ546_201, partial [Bacteroidota bacterium]
ETMLSWEFYAMLYDKISVRNNGYQRYGTQYEVDQDNKIKGLYPLENAKKVNEWRKQVGLSSLSDE